MESPRADLSELAIAVTFCSRSRYRRGSCHGATSRIVNGTEEMAHIEMLATAVALDLEDAPVSLQEEGALPVPNSHPQSEEHRRFSYAFIDPRVGPDAQPLAGRYTHGASLDGKGEFSIENAAPLGDEPMLGEGVPRARCSAAPLGVRAGAVSCTSPGHVHVVPAMIWSNVT